MEVCLQDDNVFRVEVDQGSCLIVGALNVNSDVVTALCGWPTSVNARSKHDLQKGLSVGAQAVPQERLSPGRRRRWMASDSHHPRSHLRHLARCSALASHFLTTSCMAANPSDSPTTILKSPCRLRHPDNPICKVPRWPGSTLLTSSKSSDSHRCSDSKAPIRYETMNGPVDHLSRNSSKGRSWQRRWPRHCSSPRSLPPAPLAQADKAKMLE